MSLSLEHEREMLDELRETAIEVSSEEYREYVRERIGVAQLDQIEAAAAEVKSGMRQFAASLTHQPRIESRELGVLVLAGTLRCLAGHRCEHAVRGDRPLWVVLPARVASCDRCLPRFRGALVAAQQRIVAGADRLCDFCLHEPEVDEYRDVQVAFGPYSVGGSMCGDCWDQLREQGA